MRAPFKGGLEYMGRMRIFSCDSTLLASSASRQITVKAPARSPETQAVSSQLLLKVWGTTPPQEDPHQFPRAASCSPFNATGWAQAAVGTERTRSISTRTPTPNPERSSTPATQLTVQPHVLGVGLGQHDVDALLNEVPHSPGVPVDVPAGKALVGHVKVREEVPFLPAKKQQCD